MRLTTFCSGVMALAACSAPAFAMAAPQQAIADPWRVARERPVTVSDLLVRLDRDARFDAGERGFASAGGWTGYDPARTVSSPWAATNRDIWYEGEAYSDRLRLRTARDSAEWAYATATDTTWEFPSGTVTGQAALPLLQVDTEVPADLRNTVGPGRTHTLRLTVRHQDGLAARCVQGGKSVSDQWCMVLS